MAISQAICSSFKKELLEGKHNFTASSGNTLERFAYLLLEQTRHRRRGTLQYTSLRLTQATQLLESRN